MAPHSSIPTVGFTQRAGSCRISRCRKTLSQLRRGLAPLCRGRAPQPGLRHPDNGRQDQQEGESVQFFLWHPVLILLSFQLFLTRHHMKNSIKTLVAIAAYGAFALAAHAQPAV